MKKRRNRSALKERQQALLRSKQAQEKHARYEYGPADPMPDGSTRKAGEDVISYLVINNRLSPVQEAAAREIELIFRLTTQGLWAKTQDLGDHLERVGSSFQSGDLSRYIDAHERYADFADWSKRHIRQTKRNYHQLILDAVIYGDKMRDFERRNGMKNGTGAAWIIRGLTQYAVCANWLTTAA